VTHWGAVAPKTNKQNTLKHSGYYNLPLGPTLKTAFFYVAYFMCFVWYLQETTVTAISEVSSLLVCYTVSLRLEVPTFRTIVASSGSNSQRKKPQDASFYE
jgi:hypothetical protein